MKLGKLIHYGAESFNKDLIEPIKNSTFGVKPTGGFWISPKDSEYGWKDFCESENYEVDSLNFSFEISLKENAKIYVINSHEDLLAIPYKILKPKYYGESYYIDFEKLSKEYDAIWLTNEGQCKTRMSETMDLYGWDCESVLILNPDCIAL